MFVVMEGYIIPIIGINPGKGNDWAAKVSADIPDNGVWVAEVGLCVNIKTILSLRYSFGFVFLKEEPMCFSSLFNRTVWKDLRR